MNVLLAHAFRGQIGFLEGKLIQLPGSRFDVVSKKPDGNGQPNKLIANATPKFLDMLWKRGMLKEDDAYCVYCGDSHETCGCGAQCPD